MKIKQYRDIRIDEKTYLMLLNLRMGEVLSGDTSSDWLKDLIKKSYKPYSKDFSFKYKVYKNSK